ncbi:MAG TPA: 2-phosphosulfolactate phosphatase [Longimicrobiales bacterium]|nr:2-phosphosulfolactate phosphatase [Longimicrobiales bacterium]
MRAQVFFTPGEVDPAAIQGATVVVIDVVRASTMVEALANGARAIYPTASTEEAVRLATSLGRDDTLLCGERKGVKVEGFDLGNSPEEFSADVVEGKRLVMSTTNGTGALVRVQEAERVVVCAYTNLGAVADSVRGAGHLVMVCAGRVGRFSLDDALCAGHLLRRLGDGHDLNDAARAVAALAGVVSADEAFLRSTEAGKTLEEIGLGADLAICGQVDRHHLVAELRDQALVAAGS